MKRIYLDHSATTPVDPEVAELVLYYMTKEFGNPSSIHSFGREVRKAIEKSREIAADFISAKPEEIVFTSGGTEADNMAIIGAALANQNKGRHIITSQIEHHAVLDPFEYLEKNGFRVTKVGVDKDGLVDPDEVARVITDDTILISIMHVNNEVGTIQPIAEIGKIAKEKNIIFHTDAVQSFGKIPVNVQDLNVDLLSASGHKIYGPKGTGLLFVRKGVRLQRLFHGGGQERKRRAGTENAPGIIGFGKAIELISARMDGEMARLAALRDKLVNGIKERIDHVRLNGHPAKRIPGNANLSFEFIEGESLLLNLDMKGIAVSSGSACTSGALEPSHVLMAMGLPHEIAQASLRMTLGKDNTESDIEYVLEVLPEIVTRLRSMSPLYRSVQPGSGEECSCHVQ